MTIMAQTGGGSVLAGLCPGTFTESYQGADQTLPIDTAGLPKRHGRLPERLIFVPSRYRCRFVVVVL